MTGRDAMERIITHDYDDYELVIYIEGKRFQIYSICLEPSREELVILPDYTNGGQ